jgi:anti-anti-sigma factor
METRDVGGVHVVQLEGQVRISTQNDFKDHLDRISAEYGGKTVLLNMAGITYMNSAGIGIIVDSFKKFREQGGHLALCSLSADIFRLFEVTKLNRFIDIFEDEAAAMTKLKA